MLLVNLSLVRLIVRFVFDKLKLYMVIKGGRQWFVQAWRCGDRAKLVSIGFARTRMPTFINVRHILCVPLGGRVIGRRC